MPAERRHSRAGRNPRDRHSCIPSPVIPAQAGTAPLLSRHSCAPPPSFLRRQEPAPPPPPSFLRPSPVIPAQAGTTQAGTTHHAPTPHAPSPSPPSPIHPSPLPGGRLGGGWEATSGPQPPSPPRSPIRPFLRRQEHAPHTYPHAPRTTPLHLLPFPNSSLPPSRGEARWGVESTERTPTALNHPDRRPRRPPPATPAPPHRHSCAGRNAAQPRATCRS